MAAGKRSTGSKSYAVVRQRDDRRPFLPGLEQKARRVLETTDALRAGLKQLKAKIRRRGFAPNDQRIPRDVRTFIQQAKAAVRSVEYQRARKVANLFLVIGYLRTKRKADAALVGASALGREIQEQAARLLALKQSMRALSKAKKIRRAGADDKHNDFAKAWKASRLPERTRAAALAAEFGWTATHARKVARDFGLRK